MKRRIALVLSVLLLVTLAFAACDEAAVHTYTDAWSVDETNHWHAATCTDSEVCKEAKAAVAPHADANEDKVCDVCGYDYGHTHTYADTWTADADGHSYAATCGCKVAGKDFAAHTDANNDGACDVCAYNGGHEHTYNTDAWAMDATHHWHAAECNHSVTQDSEEHDLNDAGVCDVCGYTGEISVEKAVGMGEYFQTLVNGGQIVFDYDITRPSGEVVSFVLGNNYAAYETATTSYGYTNYKNSYYQLLENGSLFAVCEDVIDGVAGDPWIDEYAESKVLSGYNFSQIFGNDMSDEDSFYGVDALIVTLYEMAKESESLVEFTIAYEGQDMYIFTFTSDVYSGYDSNWDLVDYVYEVQVAFTLGEDYHFETVIATAERYACEVNDDETYSLVNLYPIAVFEYAVNQTTGDKNIAPKYDPQAVLMTEYALYLGEYQHDENWNYTMVPVGDAIADNTITAEAGDYLNFIVTPRAPDTAIATLDTLSITSDDPIYASPWDNTFSLSVPSTPGTYTFTLTTGLTETVYTLIVTPVTLDSLTGCVYENGISADETEYTVYVDENGAATVIFGAYPNYGADGSYTATLPDGTTGATIVSNDDAENTWTMNITAVGTYVVTMTSTVDPEISTTLTIIAEEAPVIDFAAALNGTYVVTFPMMGDDALYTITFTPASEGALNGTVAVVDDNGGTYTGEYTYAYEDGVLTYTPTTATESTLPFYLDNTTGTFSWRGNSNFVVTQTSTGSADTGVVGGPVGTYVVDFYGDILYTLTFDNGALTVVDDNAGTYSGDYTYTVDGDGVITVFKDGVETSDILISANAQGGYTFQCPSLRQPQPLVEDTGDSGEDIEEILLNNVWIYEGEYGNYVIDFYGPCLTDNTNNIYPDFTYELNGNSISVTFADSYNGNFADAIWEYDAQYNEVVVVWADGSILFFTAQPV